MHVPMLPTSGYQDITGACGRWQQIKEQLLTEIVCTSCAQSGPAQHLPRSWSLLKTGDNARRARQTQPVPAGLAPHVASSWAARTAWVWKKWGGRSENRHATLETRRSARTGLAPHLASSWAARNARVRKKWGGRSENRHATLETWRSARTGLALRVASSWAARNVRMRITERCRLGARCHTTLDTLRPALQAFISLLSTLWAANTGRVAEHHCFHGEHWHV